MRLLIRTIAVLAVMILFGAVIVGVSAVVPASPPGINESEEAEGSMSADAGSEDEGEEGTEAEGSGERGEAGSTLASLTGIARDIGIIVLVTLLVSWSKRARIASSRGFASSCG